MFVLKKVKAAVRKSWKGDEHLLHALDTGDCFGEIALMDLIPGSASVRATEPRRASARP